MKILALVFSGLMLAASSASALPSGATVWTDDGYQATVNGAFPDGNVSVRIGSSNYTYSRQRLAARGCALNRYFRSCSGETVYTQDNYTATLNGVFPSGAVSVRIGSSNYQYGRAQIAGPGCVGNICANDAVTTADGYSARVNGVFDDGYVSVRIGSSNYRYRWEQLASRDRPPRPPRPNPIPGELRPGDEVWTSDGYTARVNGVFPGGKVSVRIGSGNYQYSRGQIAVAGCHAHICSGMPVVTSDGYNAVVNGVFPDGFVSVRIGASNYRYEYSQLAPRY